MKIRMCTCVVIVCLGVVGCTICQSPSTEYAGGWYSYKAGQVLDTTSRPYMLLANGCMWHVSLQPWGYFDGTALGMYSVLNTSTICVALCASLDYQCYTGTISRAGIRWEQRRPEAFSPRVSCPLPRRMVAHVMKTKYNEDIWIMEGSRLYEGGFWGSLFSLFRPKSREIVIVPFIRKDGSIETVPPRNGSVT